MNIIIIIAITVLGALLMFNMLVYLLTVLVKLFGMILLCGLLFLGCFFLVKKIVSVLRKRNEGVNS